jgi:CheY-like chemotaxis protein
MLAPAQLLATPLAQPAAPTTGWRIPASRVLVVDDGAENRELVSLVLAEQGLWVEEAENGQVALDKVAAGGFDLILMDMNMPVMDGYTAVRALRAKGVTTPVVAFSANAMKGFEDEVLAAGCNACLTKPVDIDLMLACLAEQLGGERLQTESAPAPLRMPETAPAPLAPDSAFHALEAAGPIHSRFAKQPRLSPIVSKFAARLRERLEEARESHAGADFDELGRFGHWLAGSAGMMGYDVLTAPARELESLATSRDALGIAEALALLDGMCDRLVIPEPLAVS